MGPAGPVGPVGPAISEGQQPGKGFTQREKPSGLMFSPLSEQLRIFVSLLRRSLPKGKIGMFYLLSDNARAQPAVHFTVLAKKRYTQNNK